MISKLTDSVSFYQNHVKRYILIQRIIIVKKQDGLSSPVYI